MNKHQFTPNRAQIKERTPRLATELMSLLGLLGGVRTRTGRRKGDTKTATSLKSPPLEG